MQFLKLSCLASGLLIINISVAFGAVPNANQKLIVEFKSAPQAKLIKQIESWSGVTKIQRFTPFKTKYFSRLYEIETPDAQLTTQKLQSLPIIQKVERDYAVDTYSIIPSKNTNPATNDKFYNYQWALENKGQILLKDIDDIHLERLEGQDGIDTGWHSAVQQIEKDIRQDVIVAVIDSGVDFDHEDLKNKILKNDLECSNGRIPPKPQEDKDHNGYVGDCMGWNFTALDPRQDNRPYDDVGHGTHIAGILAAETGNRVGISGFSNRIKILPIKVLMDPDKENQFAKITPDESDNQDVSPPTSPSNPEKKRRQPTSLTSRIAKGILYAVQRGAHVINLSLGWPHRIDTTYLREAFAEARKHHVVIVAAVGNNDNSRQIYPCAYHDVICVGSINNQGQYSEFSNYGGHVDLLGPGDNILSLHPSTDPDDSFSTNGYAIKSGTSQAAPYISGMVAVLKGVWPQITQNEIIARLLLSADKAPVSKKYSLGGMARIDRALEMGSQPVIRPIFKELDQIKFDQKTKQFQFQLPIKNFWQETKDIRIRITSQNPAIQLNSGQQRIAQLASGQSTTVSVMGRILNEKAHSEVGFDVELTTGSTSIGTFHHQVVVVMNLSTSPDLTKFAFQNEDPDLSLTTVTSHNNADSSPEYYTLRESTGDFQFKFYKLQPGYLIKKCEFHIPHAARFISLTKLDVNLDGHADYMIRTLAEREIQTSKGPDKEVFLQYSYADNNCRPLYGDRSHIRLKYKGEFQSFKDEFLPYDSKFVQFRTEWGTMSLPVFLGHGVTPQTDTNSDPLEFEANPVISHLYYFSPKIEDGDPVFDIHALNNTQFEKDLKNKLHLRFKDQLDFLEILTQNYRDFQVGHIRILVSIGQGYLRQNYILETDGDRLLNSQYSLLPVDHAGTTLAGHFLNSVIGLDGLVPEYSAASSFVGFLSETLAQLTFLNSSHPEFISTQTRLEQIDKKDQLLDYVRSYQKGDTYFGFFLSKSHLILKTTSPIGTQTLQAPIIRFSFLPGQIFRETLYPIVRGSGKEMSPALYVNASQVSSQHFYVWTIQDGELIAPMDLNIEIPSGCRSMNPVRFGAEGGFAYAVLCGEGDSQEMQFLPIR